MRTSYRRIAAFMGLWALLLPGCQGAEEEAEPEVAQQAPPQGTVSKKMREISATPELIAQGKQVFSTTCIACHGPTGDGIIGAGPQLTSSTFLAAASDDLLIRTVTNGRAGTTMIPWGQSLGNEKVQAVVAYVRSLNPVEAAELNELPPTGAAVNGATTFRSICAGCHGVSGGGYQETANGTGIGRKAFLDSVSNGYLRYIIKHGKSGTKMRPFDEGSKVAVANLNDQQIEDVIAYLRAHAW